MRRRLRARARAIEGSPAQICARAARRSQSSVPDGGRGSRHSEMRRHSRALHGCGKRPSRPTRPRARFGGGSTTWRRPCAAGPLPQGRAHRPFDGSRAAGRARRAARHVLLRARCTAVAIAARHAPAPEGAVSQGAGPTLQGHCRRAHGLNDGSRAAGKARRAACRVLSSGAVHGRTTAAPHRPTNHSHATVVRTVSHDLSRPLYASV